MDDQTLMPFGKHEGVKLGEIPSSYFDWLFPKIKEKAPNKRSLTEKLLFDYITKKREKNV